MAVTELSTGTYTKKRKTVAKRGRLLCGQRPKSLDQPDQTLCPYDPFGSDAAACRGQNTHHTACQCLSLILKIRVWFNALNVDNTFQNYDTCIILSPTGKAVGSFYKTGSIRHSVFVNSSSLGLDKDGLT
jgi:hypothetical protein